MKIRSDDYRVKEGEAVDLEKLPTRTAPLYGSKDEYQRAPARACGQVERAAAHALRFRKPARSSSSSRAWTAPGKTAPSATSCRASTRRAARCTVSSSRARKSSITTSSGAATGRCRNAGRIGIFNRSYYEEVLVVRVHPELLANQGLPSRARRQKGFWKDRYHSITGNGEAPPPQSARGSSRSSCICRRTSSASGLLARIDDPQKNWKFNRGGRDRAKALAVAT